MIRASNVGGISEKELMLQAIRDLKDQIQDLSDSIASNILNKSTIEDIVDKTINKKKQQKKDDNFDSVAIKNLLAEYNAKQESRVEELKKSISTKRSSIADIPSEFIKSLGKQDKKTEFTGNDVLSNYFTKMTTSLSEKLKPKKEIKKEIKKEDDSVNPEFYNDGTVKVLNKIKQSNKLTLEQQQYVDSLLDNLTKNQEKVKRKGKTATSYVEQIEKDKKDLSEEIETIKFKYSPKNFLKSISSDLVSQFGKKSNQTDFDGNEMLGDAFSGGMKRLGAFLSPSRKNTEKKEEADQYNPEFYDNDGLIKDIHRKVSAEYSEDDEEDNEINEIQEEARDTNNVTKKNQDILYDIQDGVFDLDQYVRIHLADEIVEKMKQLNGDKVNKEEDDKKEEESEEEPSFFGKIMNYLSKGWKLIKNVGSMVSRLGGKLFNFLKSGFGTIGRLVSSGLSSLGRMGGTSMLSRLGGPVVGGAGMAGAAVVALGAASAYTMYKTYDVAKGMVQNKTDVRDSTKGSSRSVIDQNHKLLSDDSDEVKRGIGRYKKVGLSDEESTAASKAERQSSRIQGTAASMASIFTAAKHSTDFRTSQSEVDALTNGEVTAENVRNTLYALNQKLADPQQVRNMSPKELQNTANQIKFVMTQLEDLKDTWEISKKRAKGTFFNSPWVNDKDLVDNGDAVINSLITSATGIEKVFNEWTSKLSTGASQRSLEKKQLTEQKASEMKVEKEKSLDIKNEIEKPKTIPTNTITPIKETLKENIKTIEKETVPSDDKIVKGVSNAINDNNKSINDKLDIILSKLMVEKKQLEIPPTYTYPSDMAFRNLTSISRGM